MGGALKFSWLNWEQKSTKQPVFFWSLAPLKFSCEAGEAVKASLPGDMKRANGLGTKRFLKYVLYSTPKYIIALEKPNKVKTVFFW